MIDNTNISQYNLNSFYKGKFLGYVDKNYKDTNDYKIYVEVKELLLNDSSTDKLNYDINDNNIKNASSLGLEGSIIEINSIIARPIFYNGLITELKENDTVFVFFIDNDPKKIFYVPISNDINTFNVFNLRVKNNIIKVNINEISLVHENDKGANNSIVINEKGTFITGDIYHNGTKIF